MKNLKKITQLLTLVTIAALMFSCKKEGCTDPKAMNYSSEAKKDDGSCTYPTPSESKDNEVVSGHITENTTWTADKIWELAGKVVVDNGVTLTIEPGTIIKGREGTGSLASALVVAKGATIIADGTASNPIIFTSILDDIKVGEQSGTNLDATDTGLWGGLIVLGNAPVSSSNGDNIAQIEGIPTTEVYGAYGGSNNQDNSGSLTYISIRHCGAMIGAGNEINGLTLGGVGAGTQISNIEVLATIDDGVEFFGGSVNASNIIVYYQGDDGIDIDQNYSGTVANFKVVNGPNSGSGLEIDGPEGSTYTDGLFRLKDGTLLGTNVVADFKSKAQGNIENVIMQKIEIASSYATDCSTIEEDAYSHLIDANPTLIFTNSKFDSYEVYTESVDASSSPCSISSPTIPTSILNSNAGATGSTESFSWSLAVKKGLL